jgi:hypothetical protein
MKVKTQYIKVCGTQLKQWKGKLITLCLLGKKKIMKTMISCLRILRILKNLKNLKNKEQDKLYYVEQR